MITDEELKAKAIKREERFKNRIEMIKDVKPAADCPIGRIPFSMYDRFTRNPVAFNDMRTAQFILEDSGKFSNEFVDCALMHAYFESRWLFYAFNPAGPAYGFFQLTPTGVGKSRSYFMGGKAVGELNTEKTYNGFSIKTNVKAWMSAAIKLKMNLITGEHEDVYSKMFWSSLCAGKKRHI